MKRANILEIDYMPSQLEFRDRQLKKLASAMRPGLEGNRPLNTILLGLPGTGKSTSVRMVFDEIEGSTGRVLPVSISCLKDRKVYAIFSTICEKLHGHRPPPSGLPLHTLVENIGRTVAERDIVLVVCLDDADYLLPSTVLNTTLDNLLRLHEKFPGAKTSVILTFSMMDEEVSEKIDPCVNSVLQASEVYYPPYNRDEVRSILGVRVRDGLFPGVIAADQLDLITDMTVESGDIRVGLDLIRRCVRSAEDDGRDVVNAADIESAFEEARDYHLDAVMSILSQEERQLLGFIAETSQGNGTCMTSGALYNSVNERLDFTYTTFFNRLKKFDDLRLIDLTYRIRDNTNEIAMRYDVQKVREKCVFPD